MPKTATTLIQLAQIRADNRELLNKITNTQGTALGRKNFDAKGSPTGDPCVLVYVPHKVHESLLPKGQSVPPLLKSADGKWQAPTDVVVTVEPEDVSKYPALDKKNKALVRKLQWADKTMKRLAPGVQVSSADDSQGELGSTVGTLGVVVRQKGKNGRVGFLTSQHVALRPGHSVYIPSYNQPTMRVGITRDVFELRADDAWLEGIDEPFAFVRADAAFVEATPEALPILSTEVTAMGKIGEPFPIELNSMNLIGTRVKKVGRSSGVQRGVIVAFGYSYYSEEEQIDRLAGYEPANFYTDLLIAPSKHGGIFSRPGDSGALVLLDEKGAKNNRPIAMLWGGWIGDAGRKSGPEHLTYATCLTRILASMSLELHP